jgi:hypothetical protein
MTRYVYFISYLFSDGTANCEITLDNKITSIHDVTSISKIIHDQKGKTVTVINFILLREEEVK